MQYECSICGDTFYGKLPPGIKTCLRCTVIWAYNRIKYRGCMMYHLDDSTIRVTTLSDLINILKERFDDIDINKITKLIVAEEL